MRRRTQKEGHSYNVRKQQKTLEDFAAYEVECADELLNWYRLRNEEILDDEYRATAYFINKEISRKPGSLILLYQVYLRCLNELPKQTKETAFDLLSYRFKMYTAALKTEGHDDREDW